MSAQQSDSGIPALLPGSWPRAVRSGGRRAHIVRESTGCDQAALGEELYAYFADPGAWALAPHAVDALLRVRAAGEAPPAPEGPTRALRKGTQTRRPGPGFVTGGVQHEPCCWRRHPHRWRMAPFPPPPPSPHPPHCSLLHAARKTPTLIQGGGR